MSKKKVAILDFDGTFTDINAEIGEVYRAFMADISSRVGISGFEFLELIKQAEACIAAEPLQHGWMPDGFIVAGATVDPHIFMRCVSGVILTVCGYGAVEREKILDDLFAEHNPKIISVFKEAALDTLRSIERDRVEVYVVTNSHTDSVKAKIRNLGAHEEGNHLDWLVDRVYGTARKYHALRGEMYQTLSLPGLGRPVHVHRPSYIGLIDQLRQAHGCAWEDVCVVGDIFEMDLAAPLDRGAEVALMLSDRTPAYEIDYLTNHPRACVFADLHEILPFIHD
jgi:FMN phosphatase YigB (HAD superfamily)